MREAVERFAKAKGPVGLEEDQGPAGEVAGAVQDIQTHQGIADKLYRRDGFPM